MINRFSSSYGCAREDVDLAAALVDVTALHTSVFIPPFMYLQIRATRFSASRMNRVAVQRPNPSLAYQVS
jgi:hypothetical protein